MNRPKRSFEDNCEILRALTSLASDILTEPEGVYLFYIPRMDFCTTLYRGTVIIT